MLKTWSACSDDEGELALHQQIELDESVAWTVGRTISGKFVLGYVLKPSVDKRPSYGEPAIDLRCDQGGLLGSGLGFLPELSKVTIYRNVVEWGLSKAPEGTTAVWTLVRAKRKGRGSVLLSP